MTTGLLTYSAALRQHASMAPRRPAITLGETTVTRRELDQRTDAAAAALLVRGCHPGSIVAFTGPNSIHLLMIAFAVWKLGATPFPIPHRRRPEEMADLLTTVAPTLAVGLPEAVDWPGQRVNLDALFPARPDPVSQPLTDVPPSHLRVGVSGGSTGPPKAVLVGQGAEVDLGDCGLPGMRANGTHVMPLSITDGTGFVTATHGLACGAHIVLMTGFDADRCLDLVIAHRADWMAVTQPVLLAIQKLPGTRTARLDHTNLTVCHFSGPVGDWLKRWWIDRLGATRVHGTYGATDARGSVRICGDEWLRHPGSVGPASVGPVRVLDPIGQEVPAGEVGEIHFQRVPGRREFRYLGRHDPVSVDGWESVGDLGRIDAEGFLYVLDRGVDVVVLDGTPVYPSKVEAELERHPLVRSALAVRGRGPDGRQALVAVLDCPGSRPEWAVLLTRLRGALPAAFVPRGVCFTDQPLRDLAGKANRKAWREWPCGLPGRIS